MQQYRERIKDLQCELAVQMATVKDMMNQRKADLKEVETLKEANDF